MFGQVDVYMQEFFVISSPVMLTCFFGGKLFSRSRSRSTWPIFVLDLDITLGHLCAKFGDPALKTAQVIVLTECD